MKRSQQIRAALDVKAKEEAKLVGFSCWEGQFHKVLNLVELDEVSALWETLPGHTSWRDAALEWLKQLEAKGQ